MRVVVLFDVHDTILVIDPQRKIECQKIAELARIEGEKEPDWDCHIAHGLQDFICYLNNNNAKLAVLSNGDPRFLPPRLQSYNLLRDFSIIAGADQDISKLAKSYAVLGFLDYLMRDEYHSNQSKYIRLFTTENRHDLDKLNSIDVPDTEIENIEIDLAQNQYIADRLRQKELKVFMIGDDIPDINVVTELQKYGIDAEFIGVNEYGLAEGIPHIKFRDFFAVKEYFQENVFCDKRVIGCEASNLQQCSVFL